ncbi:MAG: DNA-processing protein DprA [Acidimicrobiales bacterium]
MSDAELAAQLALLQLPKIGPARLSWLLTATAASEVLRHLRLGRLPPATGPRPSGVTSELVARWFDVAGKLDELTLLGNYAKLGIEVIGKDDPRWQLTDDPEPPSVLFAQGRLGLLTRRPTVAIVGTRRCSTIGRTVARSFGSALAEAGVAVVSGLAAGIDGAAHEGALSTGRPAAIAIVGSGLDVVYPRANAGLWRRLAQDGLLISESPLGARPERWRFPARNRIIAGFADVVVVVESHAAGGSLLTVGEAVDRGVTVMAVPGAVTNPASTGTNQLLVEGAPPACTAEDILDQLDRFDLPAPAIDGEADRAGGEQPVIDRSVADVSMLGELSALARSILADASAGALHLDDLLDAHRVPIPQLLAAVDELDRAGLATLDGSTLITVHA